MFDQITNKRGEELYILTTVYTSDLAHSIIVNTWEKCKEYLENITTERSGPEGFTQLIHKEIFEEKHLANASIRCGGEIGKRDYFAYLTIEPLYTEAW